MGSVAHGMPRGGTYATTRWPLGAYIPCAPTADSRDISAAHQRPGEGIPREDSQQVPADSSTFQQVAANAAGSAGSSRFQQVPQVPAGSAGTSRTQQFPAMPSRFQRVAARSSKSQQNAESAAHSSRSQQVPAIPAGRSRFQQVQIYCADSCIRFAEKPRRR